MGLTYFCTRCGQDKPTGAFSPSQVRSNGRGWCRKCHNDNRRPLRNGTRVVIKLYDTCQASGCDADISHRGWNAKWCSDVCAARGWREANPGAHRNHMMKCVYGLSVDQFNQLLEEQNGCCNVCNRVPPLATGRHHDQWNVDHCHTTGDVRGLLCPPCNSGIGHLKDDPELVRAALAYIEKHLSDQLCLPETASSAPSPKTSSPDTLYCARCDRHLTRKFFTPSVWAKSIKKAWCRECYTRDARVRRGVIDPPPPSPPRTCEGPGCSVDISHMRAHARWCSKSCTAAGWRHENPGARREYWVKTLYGLTTAQADWLLDSQDGACAICRTGESKQWNIDHCHDSGAVRGVLCSPCNLGLGFLGDDPTVLRQAIAYLENPPAKRIQLVR